MAAAIRHRGPDGFGLALDDGAGPRLRPAGDLRHPRRLAAARGRRRRRPRSSTTARSTTTPSCAPTSSATGAVFSTTCDTEVCCALLERDGLAALDRAERPVRLRLVAAGAAPADDGPRPLRRPAAALRRCSPTARSSSAPRRRRSSPPARSPPSPTSPGSTRSSRSGARARRARAFAGVSQVPPGGFVVWEGGRDHRRAPLVAPEDARRRRRQRRRRTRGAAARQRAAAAARRRAGRDLPLRRPRLEPDHRARPAGAGRQTCAASRSPSATRTTTSAPTRRRSRAALGTTTTSLEVGCAEIAEALPEVDPPRRDAADPHRAGAALPARAARFASSGITVVATGEGADEVFWGYDLFKEVAIRELHERDPERALGLLDGLYPHLGGQGRRGRGLAPRVPRLGRRPATRSSSHLSRAAATGAVKALFSAELRRSRRATASSIACARSCPRRSSALDPARAGRLARAARRCSSPTCSRRRPTASRWHTASRAGSRSSTIGSSGLPRGFPRSASSTGMRDKVGPARPRADRSCRRVDRRARQAALPRARGGAVLRAGSPGLGRGAAVAGRAAETGFWDPQRVAGLVRRCRAGRAHGVREGMALVGVLTTQLWHRALPRRRAARLSGRDGRAAGQDGFDENNTNGRQLDELGERQRAKRDAGLHRGAVPLHAARSGAGDADQLLGEGIIDSLGFVELVEEVQSRYGVTVDDTEITEENFGSVDAIAGFVERKQGAG